MNTVLIIDDSDINLTLIKALVLKLGECAPVLFDNPLRALDWCREHVPDLVIVDYMMPDMDGLKFISAFRALHGRNEIPVLMVTADFAQPNACATSATSSAFALPSTGGDFSCASHVPSSCRDSNDTRELGLALIDRIGMPAV